MVLQKMFTSQCAFLNILNVKFPPVQHPSHCLIRIFLMWSS